MLLSVQHATGHGGRHASVCKPFASRLLGGTAVVIVLVVALSFGERAAATVTPPSVDEKCENPLFNSTVSKAQANGIIGEMLIKFGVEPDFVSNAFACAYYFSHIDLYMQARHEIHPADFPEVREANSEFFACLDSLAHGSNEVFNEVRPASSDGTGVVRRGRFDPPLDPTLVALCGMKEGQWRFPRNLF